MKARRIYHHPILGFIGDRKPVTFTFDNQLIEAYEGETIAASLLAHGIRTLRFHEESGEPKGIYCNMGHCFECRVRVNGQEGIRSCLTLVEEGLVVHSGQALPLPLRKGEREG
ncbi:(2Fe-2S)-binding protein [Salinithrix halophila]|uniref:(2Fe-2S)-binding protein n=1 Tax=Salinithrix halophila TaxID=1485204 RepID=A0ABV8JHS6_9BACL